MRRTLADMAALVRGQGVSGLKNAVLSTVRGASFSQYAEDIFASRLLPFGKDGFYVDVGAAYPVLNSNTYRYYLKGWSGLTVEPNPVLAAQHRLVRPRDTCISVGVAATPGRLVYNRFIPADYNTFDERVAADLLARGIANEPPLEIATRPLTDILAEHAGNRVIDLMTIDCEGFDLIAAQSSDWRRFRPKLVMIEDHQPALRQALESPIALLLMGNGYELVARLSYTSFFVAYEARSILPGAAAARLNEEHS